MEELRDFKPGVLAPEGIPGPAWWFAFAGEKLLVHEDSHPALIPHIPEFTTLGLPVLRRNYLGLLEGEPCFAVELPDPSSVPAGMAFHGLRSLYGRLAEDLFWVAGRAVQIVDWDRTHQFCGKCGGRTVSRRNERAKECPQCGLIQFPRLAPAIIVLVERGNEMLLGRARRFPAAIYSTLAGFVEPGETLEEAVMREVKEESGISVKNIRYFGSQPWPFPHSLMIGFTAEYAGGEIVVDDDEMVDARWFTPGDLPGLPGPISIARKLIDAFLARHR
jgi:NAD+ diphosphatase